MVIPPPPPITTYTKRQQKKYYGGTNCAYLLYISIEYIQVIVIVAEHDDIEQMMLAAYSKGMVGDTFVWIGADTMTQINTTLYPPNNLA